MQAAIVTSELQRRFGDFVAVQGLDLEVPAGSFFGFLGPNGAGKSTTIKMLTGLLRISGGFARVAGHNIDDEPVEVKRKIGVVPEEMALFDRLTGPEYLCFVGRMYGLPRELINDRSNELLELMELENARRKLVVDYSHGMKKKLAFCASLIHEPEILFLDEPFEGIDAISSQQIKLILDQLVKTGVTIFLTSHILEIVERLCSHIAVIHHGRLVAQGPFEELRRRAGDAGDRSLEELFLSLVGEQGAAARGLSWLA